MNELLQAAERHWSWVTPAVAFILWLLKLARGRSSPHGPREPAREGWIDLESTVFPQSPRPGRGLARLLSSPARLALKEAGDQAIRDELKGLRADLDQAHADNDRLRSDNRRLRAELASSGESSAPSTATATERTRRSMPRHPRSGKSETSEKT